MVRLGYNCRARFMEVRTLEGSTFAARLKELRKAAGLSQAELAELAGMHRFGVAKLEQGIREPSWATVQALAAALGVKCEAFEGTEKPAKKGK